MNYENNIEKINYEKNSKEFVYYTELNLLLEIFVFRSFDKVCVYKIFFLLIFLIDCNS